MKKEIAIIGGGISGMCSAYFLHKSGYQVSIFDANKIGVECSYGNAGLIVPSHFETLASPGILKKGLKWMLNPNSPFFLKPKLDLDLLKWIIRFNTFCTTKHVNENKHFLKDINLYSLDLYKQLKQSSDFEFDFKNSGLLMMCKEEKTLKEEQALVKEAKEIGLNAEILNSDDLKKLEPNATFNVLGASYFKDDSKIQPYDFIIAIKNYLEKNGVNIYENCLIEDVNISNGKVVSIVDSSNNDYSFDQYVFTTGIYTSKIAKKFNLNLPMQGGKGFSFITEKNEALDFSTPMILAEEKVAVTPYSDYVRFGGTMMLGVNDLTINDRRINNIRKAANSYINGLEISESSMKDIWAGLRPCSPDGIPYIGRSDSLSNVIIATGHAMMGVSLGPATGKIVSDLINENNTDLNIQKMNLNRFT
ncbi:NAD(P)/FAD-dependent oxidoreductase [Poseidonibacter lekithochrous]|uniref:NAD(P)/FAD-dependent oxidoreductase n=1 Tax=Poseidonibacter lekithochrous TaxID=1904463 RepID=UPI0008FC9B57|nr:FAD-dependent oxidoreductase [Poseidonibacter lekithochrous]QKJ21781.1 D-amino acid dehydrogenase, small subunit [Poseidonibacter lekithochrous]